MKQFFIKLKKSNKAKKYFWVALSIIFLICLWWILSATDFFSRIIPSPIETIVQMHYMSRARVLWTNVFNTLWKVLVAFSASFLLAFLLAVLAAFKEEIRFFLSPIVTIIRALPTIGVVLILFMIIRLPELAAIIIAFMMVFPVLYENFYSAIKETDSELLEMARVHRVSFFGQVRGVYVPHIMPYVFSASVAGIGMALKVVIASEIIGIPIANTLGTAMQQARDIGAQAGLLFMWLVVAVLLSFALEGVVKLIGRFCMPWKRGVKQ